MSEHTTGASANLPSQARAPSAFEPKQIAALKQECGALRIRVRELERELAEAKASAATADGIAAQVFMAIRTAMSGRSSGVAAMESAVA